MAKNLRTYLEKLKAMGTQELIHTTRPVDPKLGLTAVLQKLEQYKRWPAVFFEDVAGSSMPVVSNIFASRDRLALAVDAPLHRLNAKIREVEQSAVEPVEAREAPCQEVIHTGSEASLSLLPKIWHNSGDGGPYITGGCVTTKHPHAGFRNLGIYRMMIRDDKTLTIHLSETSHARLIFEEYQRLGKAMPVAISIGHHPAFYMAAASLGSYGVDEYALAGAYLGEPLTLTRALGSDLEVPSEAEIVLEGEIRPGHYDEEGPFGEYTGTYGQPLQNPVVTISTVTTRRDPIYLDIFSGHADHQLLAGTLRLSWAFRAASAACPTVREVNMPTSGCCRFFCFVSIKKRFEGEPKNVAMTVLGADACVRYVVVVDEEVDVFDDSAVMRAVSMNVRVPDDVFVVTQAKGSPLDPTVDRGILVTKVGIDATRKPHSARRMISVDEASGVELADYFREVWA